MPCSVITCSKASTMRPMLSSRAQANTTTYIAEVGETCVLQRVVGKTFAPELGGSIESANRLATDLLYRSGSQRYRHACLQQGAKGIRFERFAQQKALHLVAHHRFELAELRCGLDAFGHHVHVERMGERDDRGHDRRAFGTLVIETVGKKAVDLQLLDAEALQVGKARVAGAEIVDG